MHSTVYNAHFGFRETPFGLTPDPQFFYSNAIYREALATLAYGLEARRGFIVVTGETGTGKTTLLRKLMRAVEPKFKTAYIFNTLVSFTDLLRLILTDLGLQGSSENKLEMIGRLNEYLLEQHKDGHIVALLIDEAQDLSIEILEELRLLTNLETDKEKLLQIALIGQPELERKLGAPELRQLSQRVALRCRLTPLAANEVGSYIESRLQAVAHRTEELFDGEAVGKIALYSGGIPRLINIICDNALLICYAASKSKIDGAMIDEVAGDLLLGQAQVGTGIVAAIIKKPPAKNDFPGIVPGNTTEHATTGNPVHPGLGDVLIPVADSPAEFDNHQRRRWLQIGPLLTVIVMALGALLYPPKMGFLTRDSGENEVPDTQKNVEFAKLFRDAGQADTSTTPPQVQMPTPSIPQPSSSDQKVSVGALQSTAILRGAIQHLPSQEIAKPLVTTGDAKQFEDERPSGDKLEKNSMGIFDVVGASFVRNKPSSNADVITTLEPGTRIAVARRGRDYYWIQSTGDEPVRGYVHREDAFFERRK